MKTALGVLGEGLRLLVVAIGIAVIVFFLIRAIPGDVVDVLAIQGDLTYEQQVAIRAELGLHTTWIEQFWLWCRMALAGDLGQSARFGRPVTEMIGIALGPTLQLAGASFAIGLSLSIGVAVLAAVWPRSVFAWLVDAINIWAIAMPTFSVGIAAVIVFALWLGWMPAIGTMIAPAIILGIDTAGTLVKMLHEDLKEMDSALWVRTARAKGVGRLRIVLVHLLPNAASVVLAMTGIVLAGLVGGAITMEVVFGLPGIGTLTMQAMKGRDYPLIQAIILLLALGVVLANFVTDLLQRLIDPRLRAGGRG